MKWVTLKPSLVFNWVMFLGGFSVPFTAIQTVSLNSKFRSLIVRILVRKDKTQTIKFLKGNFIQRNKKGRGRKDKVLQIFSTICRKENVSRKQSSLNLCLFLFFFSFFFFFCFIQKFQSSLKFEFSLRFFSAEFSVKFSFS